MSEKNLRGHEPTIWAIGFGVGMMKAFGPAGCAAFGAVAVRHAREALAGDNIATEDLAMLREMLGEGEEVCPGCGGNPGECCPTCHKAGVVPTCHGTGQSSVDEAARQAAYADHPTCKRCGGRRVVGSSPGPVETCPECKGTGCDGFCDFPGCPTCQPTAEASWDDIKHDVNGPLVGTDQPDLSSFGPRAAEKIREALDGTGQPGEGDEG